MKQPNGFIAQGPLSLDLPSDGPATRKEFVLSRHSGFASTPRDLSWLDTNIPCQAACPAHTDIPGYLDAIARGDFEQAYRINLADNVFPAVLGRVCTRPCEPVCRHGFEGLGEPVAICFSKRSTADFLQRSEPVVLDKLFPPSGKRVAVVGAGAAGLAAARELALWGHDVVVFEKYHRPGGLMVLGIPEFRLPRAVVEREIAQIAALGVEIRCGVELGRDIALDRLRADYDAVILSTGALAPALPGVPGEDLAGVSHGLPFLLAANEGHAEAPGRRVVVIGGGFTAVDCARMARRLGAESVRVFYRRSESEMYITPHEIEEMRREGVEFEALASPVEYVGEQSRLSRVRLVRNRLGAPDASGRRQPEAVEGSEFEVEADTVLLATGQRRDFAWAPEALAATLHAARDVIETSEAGLFLTGDASEGSGSLIDAIGHARRCARIVDRHLTGKSRFEDGALITKAAKTGRTRALDALPRNPIPVLPLDRRGLRDEVDTGYARETAQTEASRCYLCHFKFEIDNDLCIYCDRCLKVKPVENCIVKVSALEYDAQGRVTGYTRSTSSRDYKMLFIDQNQCIRCNACAEVCPVECISLQKVQRCTRMAPG